MRRKILDKVSAATTYSKIITLLFFFSIGFLLLFAFLFYFIFNQEKKFHTHATAQYNNEVKALFNLNSEAYTSVISDITYWDEFVSFIHTRNLNWFNTSIANFIDAYKVDYIASYDLEGNFITKVSTSKIVTPKFIPQAVFKELYNKKFLKFYLKIPEGIVEVYGATVHPSSDPFKNKTKPSGYFFMVRLLDSNYFTNLEKISSSEIAFFDPKNFNDKDLSKTAIEYNLNDFSGQKIGSLLIERKINVDFETTKWLLFVAFFFFGITIVVYLYYAKKWSLKPLNLIKEILKTSSSGAIRELKHVKGEFYDIANLFEDNIYQKKQLEIAKKRAEESDLLKTSFLTNLSHEIRTPMNAIIGFTELLKNDQLPSAEKEEYMKVIHDSGDNLVSIIDDLVEMSKIDTNLIKPNFRSTDLDALMESVFQANKISIPQDKELEYKLINSSVKLIKRIIIDDVKFSEIVTNLIENAIKFTKKGFVIITYDVNLISKTITVTVKDSGVGIPKEFHQSIFKRFNRVENDFAIEVGGLGLGLSIANAYVELLGGKMHIQSEENVGSTFSFTVPFDFDTEYDKLMEGMKDLPERDDDDIVLIAEDDNINFMLFEKLMKNQKFRIIRANNGAEAVKAVTENPSIDLVLMDIKMPIMDGYEATVEIKKLRPDLPVIAQTAYSSSEEIEKIKESGFNGYIAKPIDKTKLFNLIASILS